MDREKPQETTIVIVSFGHDVCLCKMIRCSSLPIREGIFRTYSEGTKLFIPSVIFTCNDVTLIIQD